MPRPVKRITALSLLCSSLNFSGRFTDSCKFQLVVLMNLMSNLIWTELMRGISGRVEISCSVFSKTFLLSQLKIWLDHTKGHLHSSFSVCIIPDRGLENRTGKRGPHTGSMQVVPLTLMLLLGWIRNTHMSTGCRIDPIFPSWAKSVIK